MSIADYLGKSGVKVPGEPRKEPLWEGPQDDGPLGGVSQSMLSNFLVCRERFRVKYCEGIRQAEGWDHRMGYGHIWHAAEEEYGRYSSDSRQNRVDSALRAAKQCASGFVQQYRTSQNDIEKWWQVCKVQFPLYVDYWALHPDADAGIRKPLYREKVFHIPYGLPSGRVVWLKGKLDGADYLEDELWVVENKTKGDIKEGQIHRQLYFDLQTMIYTIALIQMDKRVPAGVLYNVVRRPLSGGKGSIVQKEPTKGAKCSRCNGTGSKNDVVCQKCDGVGRTGAKPGETKEEYYTRLGDILAECPEEYFMRWKVPLSSRDIDLFQRTCFNPLLENLCEWYSWMREAYTGGPRMEDVFRPYPPHPPGIHWRHPFGVFNILDEGGSSDLDEYLASGSMVGLRRIDKLFEELT